MFCKKSAKKFSFSLDERKAGTLLEFELDIDEFPETGKVKLGKESGKLFFPLENK